MWQEKAAKQQRANWEQQAEDARRAALSWVDAHFTGHDHQVPERTQHYCQQGLCCRIRFASMSGKGQRFVTAALIESGSEGFLALRREVQRQSRSKGLAWHASIRLGI